MGTEILIRSHDPLQSRLPHDAFSLTASTTKSQTNPNSRRRRRRSPPAVKANSNDRDRSQKGVDRSTVVVNGPGSNHMMGQVKILKRGEKLPEITKSDDEGGLGSVAKSEESFDFGLGSTVRLGLDPQTVQQQIRVQKQIRVFDLKDGIYAGSNFDVSSPPPSSVPVPFFLERKTVRQPVI